MSVSSPPKVRLPNCTGNLSYAAFLPPKLMPERDEGELPGRMTAWSLNRALLRCAAEKVGRLYDLVEAVRLDGVPGVARPGGGLMVSGIEGVGRITGATGGAGSDLGSGAGGARAGAGAGVDSVGGGARAGGASTRGSGCAGTQPFIVSRPGSSFGSVAAVAAGSSSQLGSWMVAGFSHSVEGGSSAGSATSRGGGGTEEVDGGTAVSIGACCRGAEGRVGFDTGLR